jgi:hypothetical protein
MKTNHDGGQIEWAALVWRGTLAAGLALIGMTPAPGQEMRTWVDSTGSYSIQARFVSLADGKVTLQKTDGSQIEIPLEKLSAGDKGYAQAQHANAGASPFEPRASANPFAPSGTSPSLPPVTGGPMRELKSN